MLSKNIPKLKTQTILPYDTTSFITVSESVDIAAYAGIINHVVIAKMSQSATASGNPIPAYSSALFLSPTPSEAESAVLIPTPVPTANAIIRS